MSDDAREIRLMIDGPDGALSIFSFSSPRTRFGRDRGFGRLGLAVDARREARPAGGRETMARTGARARASTAANGRTETYQHPEFDMALRPEVGTPPANRANGCSG